MYICEGSGITVYETFDELLTGKIECVSEYDGNYYFFPELHDHFDHTVWKVNKSTKEVSLFDLIEYVLDIDDKATPVELETLKRAF